MDGKTGREHNIDTDTDRCADRPLSTLIDKTVGQIEEWSDGRPDRWMGRWASRRTDRWAVGQTARHTDIARGTDG